MQIKTIVLAKGREDLGIEPAGENTVRLNPQRMKIFFQTAQFMAAVQSMVEEALEQFYASYSIIICHQTTVSLLGDNHYPQTSIHVQKGEASSEVVSSLAMLSLRFAEIVCGNHNVDGLRKISLGAKLQQLAENHADQFLLIHGNKRVTTDFVISSPFVEHSEFGVQGRFSAPPSGIERTPIEGIARPDGYSQSGCWISLIIEQKPVKMNITDVALIQVCAAATMNGTLLEYSGTQISSKRHKAQFELTALAETSEPDPTEPEEPGQQYQLVG